jgi:nucleoside-diphosphate-sugar epimerase
MKTIAVTGSSGFIGRHLIARLKGDSYKVIELDYDKGFDLLKNDDLMKIPYFDLIIHLAAKSFIPKSFQEPREYYSNNYLSTLNILELARKYNSKVIYFSTYLYGNPDYLPIDENHPVRPLNPYSQSKLICEKLCEGYHRDFGVPLIIFRPFNIYGKGQNNSFLIPMIIEQFKGKEIKLKDPRPRRDFINVSDVVSAVIAAVRYDKTSFELFNLGFGQSYSIADIISIIKKKTKSEANVIFSNEIRQGEVLDTVADNTKVNSVLNWNPKIKIEDGIARILDLPLD